MHCHRRTQTSWRSKLLWDILLHSKNAYHMGCTSECSNPRLGDWACWHCQVWENSGDNSGNLGCQVQTYKISEGTLASAYVLCLFQTLVPRFWNKDDGGLEIGVSEWGIRVVSGVKLQRTRIKRSTYLIFELRYLHDKSEVFILSNRINKRINQRTNNKWSP